MFLLQHKKKITTKKKQTLDKEGDKISLCPPPTLLIVPGVVPPPPPRPPFPYDFSPDAEVGEQGRLSFCKTLKSGVCTICAALLVWDRHKLNQESIVFRDCFSSKNNNLVPCVINHLFPPPPVHPALSPSAPHQSSPPLFTVPPHPRLPQPLKCC